jgi:HSP20 family protein
MYLELNPWRRSPVWNGPAPLEKEFEKIFDVFGQSSGVFSPMVEIREDEAQYSLSLDVPGMRKDEIDIEIRDDHLHVSGERIARRASDKESVLRSERKFGKFSRAFALPKDVKVDGIEARFEDGVLDILLPKEQKAQPKKISISGWNKANDLQS